MSNKGSQSPKPSIIPIPLYSQSSQFRNWRYSKEELNEIRKDLNVLAVNRVRSMVEEERVQQSIAPTTSTIESNSSNPIPSTSTLSTTPPPPPPPPEEEIQYLTVEDEQSLVTYYLTQISALCGAFGFEEMVEATAMSYLKRFYLRNTCMDYHPKNVMLTCLFLATKTENNPISIDKFSNKIKTSPIEILSLEFLISQSLKFEFKIHHTHLAAYGLSLDLETTSLPLPLIQSTYTSSKPYITLSRLTPLEFHYAPSQIALACIYLISPLVVNTWLDSKSPSLLKSKGERMEREKLIFILEEIGKVIKEQEEKGVSVDVVREVDRRLRGARNPEKVVGSALYKKRKAEEDAEREAKASAKAAKRPISTDQNVFD